MLYGNLIFIKKTGGDGSKYPVTEKNIKIGRSENCMIRIYTPQVAPEHCQLIIDNSGQAKLRNLFTPTILNGKPLGQGDVTLCHGDVFKLGERLARWEYLPTSKYFKQLLSPTGRLVAVVNPQRRSVEIPSTSTQVSVSKSTPLGSKRKFSEKFGSENSSAAKQRKTVGLDGSLKPKIDLSKLLIGRHSIKTGKSILKTPTLKQRKSVSGIIDSRTPKNKVKNHRKSTLPSWKVSVDAQPKQSAQANKKSPSKWAVKTPSKQSLKNEVRTPSKSTPIKVKTPKRLKLDSKSGDKTLLNTILESPPKLVSVRSTRSFSKSSPAKVLSTPVRKSPVQAVRLVQSEKKSKPSLGTPTLRGLRKMSLALNRVDGGRRKSLLQKNSNLGRKSAKERKISIESETQVQESSSSNVAESRKSSRRSDATFDSPKQAYGKSTKSTTEKTPQNFNKPLNQNSVKKTTVEIAQTPPLIDFSDECDSVITERTSRKSVISSRKSLQKSVTKSSADVFQTPQKFLNKIATPSVERTKEEPSRSAVSPISSQAGSRKSGNVTSSKKVISSSKEKVSPTGVRRKLSPSISSAERAAKKLKTSSPKKPDKNKRAALLVLGKANRKQLLSQNVKVLLKQKIVKKAIKQSVALPMKDKKQKASVKKIQKSLKKKQKKPANVSSTRFSQPVKETPSSNKLIKKSINKSEVGTPNVKKLKISSPVSSAKVATPTTASVMMKSLMKSCKKTESILSPNDTEETISPFIRFDKNSESYLFDSNRRCSKRLRSKNDTERPDFVELSPTALGLIPKNIEMFKTPKEKKRKSSSLVTPRNITAPGIIKSASTSKIINRKSVSFSSKDFSLSTTAYTPAIGEKTDFDFDSFHTSNITMDVFVSPLNKSSATPVAEFVTDENVEPSEKSSTLESKKVARKLLQSPQNDRPNKLPKFSHQTKTPRNSVSGSSVLKPVVSSRVRSSPKNDLTDVRGVKKLFDTPKIQRSPKNDLSDVKGVKKLMQTPRIQKSPKNDLSDLTGVKKLMQTPKTQKSPKNDLSDLTGVKKLMQTPKIQKSPKNDLSDLRGVKKLMQTPKTQKSPKNDLSDLRGVKKLMQTPKKQKSPKNELTDLRGVKRLLQSPKNQKSPKNDLTDVTGVKQLLKTPKAQKSPQNNLSDVEGIEELFASPEKPESRIGSPHRVNKTSENSKTEILDVTGVRELFARHKPISNYDVSLSGIAELFEKNLSSGGEENKSLGVSETRTVRGKRRKLDEEKEQQVATPKARARRESANVKTPRVTRSTKPDVATDIEEGNKGATIGARKTTRAKKEELAKKITRRKVESKKVIETPKEEASKTLRKRKPVEAVKASPPKLRRKAAAFKQSASKVQAVEPRTIDVRSKTRKVEEEDEVLSLKKPAGKSKTSAKKAPKGQSKATKSGVNLACKAQKVQKGRSQTGIKQETLNGGSNISPKKTRSVSAKTTSRKTRTTAAKS